MALAISALPVSANDYLKIYFKDGHTERHYMKLVESISASKYDLEGILHDDYQVQQIVMKDTTYSYYIADIDSMSFRKVNEEEVKKDVETIAKTVTPIFEQCSTVEEMEEHIDEIINTEGVEDAWRSGTEIVVKVRDWYDMVFMYPAIPEDESSSLARKIESINAQNIKRQIQQVKEDGTKIKVAIAFQLVNDTRSLFINQGNHLRELRDEFEAMGFEADFIPSEKAGNLDLDFYSKRMFDYDIVILVTHGSYENGIHGFYTDRIIDISLADYELSDKYGYLHCDIDDAFIGTCKIGYMSSGVFLGVNETFIDKRSAGFGIGPHIVFNGACYSLKGNDNVADIFFRKGADIYIGWNDETTLAGNEACNYFRAMLNGHSHEKTIKRVKDFSFTDCVKSESNKGIFIVNTHTEYKTEQEINEEYKNNKEIELKGVTSSYDLCQNIGCYIVISTEPNVDEKNGESIQCHNAHSSGNGAKEVVFSAKYSPEPGKKYYYRACTWDGFHRNWGEERSFEIEKVKNHVVGDVFTVDDVVYKVTSISPLEVQIGNCEKGSGIESAIARNKTGAYEIPSKVTGPDGNSYSVTMLGRYSFYKCSLTSISIPNSVTSIGEHAFSDCSGLTSIKIPESVTSIGDYAFYECSGLTSIKIPESVISIGSLAFYGCSGLYSIIIPKNVSSIGYFAFNKCSYLHTVIILCSSSNIDSGLQLFKDCNNFTEAVFDCSTVIPILNDLTSLKKVTLKESVTTIGDNAFYNCSGLTSITIPNSVTNIGKAAFAYCGLPSLTIPNSVTRIGEEAFAYCSSLSFATISNRLNSIGGGVFRDCSSLTSVTIPSSVTFIEGYAFTGCNSLTSVSIPNSVTSIGTMAFAGCSSLTSIYVEAIDPPKLELYWVFDGVDENKCVLYVPKGCVDKYRSEMIWGSFKNIVEH
jgi:hypothetical protein